MFKLVIQDDEGKTTVVPLIRDEITIGRKEGNTIRLTERNVSRRHARILRNNGEVHIEDLGSYNGIRVNNARIAERVSLRVSDQVQIGDYKLYLKAEGVEQVDDARTMPIERVDTNTATDIIPAVAPPAPTAQIPIPSTPAPGQINAQLVGSPNRTLVAVADTDPQGRPVATAAAVAALTAAVGYGKLVVLSSNFAGKEFELSRPQMIVGRTDENDLVINHRSISRNHAKLVREPDTGRYTISDLQSSNGVRVNGQDYGKVELRRGDVIDLGHVRLRFVEPGEDFVFSRDAVITDVPDVGGKKGLLVAVLLGVLVLGGVVVFFLTRGPDEKKKGDDHATGPGSTGQNDLAIDAPQVALEKPDAPEQAVEPIDAGSGSTVVDDSEKGRIRAECKGFIVTKAWTDAINCSNDKLAKLDAAAAKEIKDKATAEDRAEAALRNLNDAVRDKNIKNARAEMKNIPATSVYFKEAEDKFDTLEKNAVDGLIADLNQTGNRNNCKDWNTKVKQAAQAYGQQVADKGRAKANRCIPEKPGIGAGSQAVGPGSNVIVTPPPKCDFDAAVQRGDASVSNGNHAAALTAYKQALACHGDGAVLQKAFLAACNAKLAGDAKALFPSLPAGKQNYFSQACLRYGIDPTK